MSKDQLLNIALFTLIFTLVFQFFFAPKETEQLTPGIALLANSKTTTVPSIPQVRVYNNTDGNYDFDTCNDLGVWFNSQKLVFTDTEYSTFCRSVHIEPHGWYYLPFRSVAPLFTKSGDYLIRLGSGDTAPSLSITHSEPGFLSRFFSGIFFAPIYNFFVALLTYIPGHSLGWAIVIITILIRLILLVPQRQMMESQAKMQKIQPRIQKIQEEFKGDQARIGQELLALYKKEKVNPAGSCLPLLIQMPILIGLYWVISGISDVTNHYYLYDALKSFDIEAVDSHFFGLNLQGIGGTVGIIFALILALVQWIQAKLSFALNDTSSKKPQPKVIEQKENGEFSPESFMPDPQMMQKMMLYFIPVMIGISALFLPLGVGLYWFIGTIFVIIQQWFFRKRKTQKK